MSFNSFKKNYEELEREIYVLMAGGTKSNKFWIASSYFLAYSDLETNEVKEQEGRLVWPITEKEEQTCEYFNRFNEETIYHVKVRRIKEEVLPEGRATSFYNQFYVTEILNENPVCPALEEILTEYRKPIVIQDDTLGELTLNKDLSLFSGNVTWLGKKISISLDVDKNNKATWTKARKAMKQMLAEQEIWDKEMRECAADELTSLANDWLEQDDEQKNATPITEEDFIKRINITSLNISSGGSFSAYYDDDDMFWGHAIEVYGTIKKGIKSADIAG